MRFAKIDLSITHPNPGGESGGAYCLTSTKTGFTIKVLAGIGERQ